MTKIFEGRNLSGLVVLVASEKLGLSRLSTIIESRLPNSRKRVGIIEYLSPNLFGDSHSIVDLRKGVNYSNLIQNLSPASDDIVIVENSRDRESLKATLDLIDQHSCLALTWIRGSDSKDKHYLPNLFEEIGIEKELYSLHVRAVIYSDFTYDLFK